MHAARVLMSEKMLQGVLASQLTYTTALHLQVALQRTDQDHLWHVLEPLHPQCPAQHDKGTMVNHQQLRGIA